MSKETELKAKIFDLISLTETKMEELRELNKERIELLQELENLQNK